MRPAYPCSHGCRRRFRFTWSTGTMIDPGPALMAMSAKNLLSAENHEKRLTKLSAALPAVLAIIDLADLQEFQCADIPSTETQGWSTVEPAICRTPPKVPGRISAALPVVLAIITGRTTRKSRSAGTTSRLRAGQAVPQQAVDRPQRMTEQQKSC